MKWSFRKASHKSLNRSYFIIKSSLLLFYFFLYFQVVIYLDVPAHECYEKVQVSGDEVEKRLPLEYYQKIEESYKNFYLPYARERGVTVIEMDWSDSLPIDQVFRIT